MIRTFVADGSEKAFFEEFDKRSESTHQQVEETVKAIIQDVKQRGDEAVKSYTAKFDTPNPEYYEVPQEVIHDAMTNADMAFVEAMLNCINNITDFHQRQKQNGYMITDQSGTIMGQRVRGLDRVGLYVPGGTAAYPSSVIMNAVPAKIAGVKEIIMVTPPQKDGKPNMDIIAAAGLCGVDRIFLCGGAQAVAALAFGTEEIPKVSKVVGPGNIYVATAKKLLYGTVDIDMIAGPSEILVLADETANPRIVASDLLSQAEHDVLASSILITTSKKLAEETVIELEKQLQMLPRKEIAEKSLSNYGAIIFVDSMEKGIALANEIAPEHMEVIAKNPLEYIGKIDNVGSLFLGEYTSESLGDYYAGPNHILPTNKTARFFSPLSVDDFIKKSSYIYYTKPALEKAADDIILIAEREGLTAHANSIRVRLETKE